jgi:hypothetical protein
MSVLFDEESAISMWREMISEMKMELGNNPTLSQRYRFENQWMKTKAPRRFRTKLNIGVLCRYTEIKGLPCEKCPIFWGFANLDYDATCLKDDIYAHMTLDEVLNIPAKNIREHDELDSYDTNFFDI